MGFEPARESPRWNWIGRSEDTSSVDQWCGAFGRVLLWVNEERVLFYGILLIWIFVFLDDDSCEACPGILEELETIDDDTDEHGIQFVKSNDVKLAHEIGIFSFPALVYYETGVPIMFDGRELRLWFIEADEIIFRFSSQVTLNTRSGCCNGWSIKRVRTFPRFCANAFDTFN